LHEAIGGVFAKKHTTYICKFKSITSQ